MAMPNSLEKLEYQKVLSYISKYCSTQLGKENILSRLPFNDIAPAKIEGERINQAKDCLINNNLPPLEYLPDLFEALSQSNIEGSVLNSKIILEVLRLAVVSRNLFQYLKNNSETAPDLFKLSGDLFVDKLFEHQVHKVLDENGEVKENASVKLFEIRREIRKKSEELVRSVNRIVKVFKEKDITREDYMTLRDGRIVIPVKAEHKRHIRGFIHSESSTGQTVYIEPEETLELNNDIVSLSFAEKREIERILKELTKRIASVSNQLKESLKTISYLDSVFACAQFSIEIIGAFPEINNAKIFEVNDARHPILLKKLGRNITVPLNIKISNSRKVILITGPNAGGKTVVLKTIGLLSLLVNSGIHIPVNPDSNFHFFNDILLDIGDEQSIEDDLSTFSSHLSNIKNILGKANRNSLVLLDEVGTGTDPAEGSALATAVLIQLRDKNSTVLATTHHGSLKLIANDLDNFENAAMEFDTENLKPTYIFHQGMPGSSYAFEVAERIGFDYSFLNLAKEYLEQDKHKVENFLVDIEKKSHQVEEKLKKLEIENARLTGLSNLYQQNVDKLNNEKKDIIKRAKSEAENYLSGINSKFEKIVKELKESKADKNVIKSSRKVIEELKEENKNLFKENIQDPEKESEFLKGDFAAIKNTQTAGEIVDIIPSKNKAILKVGSIKMQVDINNLVHSKKNSKEKISERSYDITITVPGSRIDIRGEKPEEAEFEVIKFIDNAYSSGMDRIEILHGKGTGALKKRVNEILKHHDKVKNFYFAPIEQGGEGITIAELK
ncbi:MAG: endonuclease MutS2 [Ignavibacteriaceae bacterium]